VNAFFEFESPITDLSFLSTEIEPQGHDAKSVRLDVALKLANGTLIDLEMQSSLNAGYLRRSLLYAALLLVTHTKKGASHTRRKAVGKSVVREGGEANAQPNVISLTLLNDRLPHKDPKKFRHSYQLRDGDDYLDKDCFRIDVIELPKLQQALDTVPPSQRLWMRLFLAQSYAEVTQLAQEEPLFLKVCEVLEMVSKNSKMQDRARMIWEGEFAVRNEKYLLEKERLEEKMRIEKEAEQKVAAAQHEAALRVAEAQHEADQRVAEAQHKADQRVAEAQHKADQRVAEAAREADQRAIEADHKAMEADQKAIEADHKAMEADHKAMEADHKAMEADHKAMEADHKAMEADHKAMEADQKAIEADQKFQETQLTLSMAVRALASTGQKPEAIATLLNLSPERVVEILNTR
jgi:chemotaxis protein histidine kinase CheA